MIELGFLYSYIICALWIHLLVILEVVPPFDIMTGEETLKVSKHCTVNRIIILFIICGMFIHILDYYVQYTLHIRGYNCGILDYYKPGCVFRLL